MNKPNNWYSMSWDEQRDWQKNQQAIEDAEYDKRRAQEDADNARQFAQQAKRNYQSYMASVEEEMSCMQYDMEARDNRIAELEEGIRYAIGVLATAYPIEASKALAMASRLNSLLDKAQP